MAGGGVRRKNRATAAPVSEGVCAFCGSSDQDEAVAGQLYALENVTVHYYCALVSCGLCQKGKDEEGLFGFLLDDILNELQRGKKLKCSYCGCNGATVGCNVNSCKKQFHLPCGRRHGVLSLFYGNYESYCSLHTLQQKVSPEVMIKVKQRKKDHQINSSTKQIHKMDAGEEVESICAICYESVNAWPSNSTFWPPCCAKDRWLHSECVQRMALSAGMHYLKCPLCNDKDVFQSAAQERGIYIPDRDAAWELESNAYAELYERPKACCAEECLCVLGREHDADEGQWELQMCLMCGGSAKHGGCLGKSPTVEPGALLLRCYFCAECAALPPPTDVHALLPPRTSRPVVTEAPEYRPLMPHRMSLRRTKGASRGLNSCNTFKMEKIVKIIKQFDETESDEDVDVTSIEGTSITSQIPSSSNVQEETTRTPEHMSENTRDSRVSLGMHSSKRNLPTKVTRVDDTRNTKSGMRTNSENDHNNKNVLTKKELVTKSRHVAINHQLASRDSIRQCLMKSTTSENDKDISVKGGDGVKQMIPFLDSNSLEKSLLTEIENRVLSPLRIIQDKIYTHLSENPDLQFSVDSNIKKMTKPGPKAAKKKIVRTILSQIIEHCSQSKQPKHGPAIHSTPTKTDILKDMYGFVDTSLNDAGGENYQQDENVRNNNENITDIVENIQDDKTIELDCGGIDAQSLNSTLTLEISNDCNSTVPLGLHNVLQNETIEELEFSNMVSKTVTEEGTGNECSKKEKIDNLEYFKSHYLSEVDRSNKTSNFQNIFGVLSRREGEEKQNEPENENKKSSKSAKLDEDFVQCDIGENVSDERIFAITENSLIKLQKDLSKVDEQFDKCKVNDKKQKNYQLQKIYNKESKNNATLKIYGTGISGDVENVETLASEIKNYREKGFKNKRKHKERKYNDQKIRSDSYCANNDNTDIIVIDNEGSKIIKVAIKRKMNPEERKKYNKKRKIEVSIDLESRNKDKLIAQDSKESSSKIVNEGNNSTAEKNGIKDGAKNIRTRKLCDDESHNFIGDLSAIDDYYLKNNKKQKKKTSKQEKHTKAHKEGQEQKVLKQTIISFSPEDKKQFPTPANPKKRKSKSHSPGGLKQTTLNTFFKVNITLA